MFIVHLKYNAPLPEVDKYLQAHRDYLDYYYQQGLLLVSGPIKPRTGGILIAMTNDRAYLESVLQKDPYTLAEIATYELTEFTPVKYCIELTDLIHKMEEIRC